MLGLAGVVTALAIDRLPGTGGHVPAKGLVASPSQPIDLPGIVLAGLASIGLGLVIGPRGAADRDRRRARDFCSCKRRARTRRPSSARSSRAAGAFAGLSFLFGSPVIAAVILIEATGLGGPMLPLVLVPGLFAAGIGSLVSIGMGSMTGLSLGSIALSPLALPDFARPDFVRLRLDGRDWPIAVAIVVFPIFRGSRRRSCVMADRRRMLVVPALGLAVAGIAIGFHAITDKGVSEVLFSGETALPGLVTNADSWSVGALAGADRLQGTRVLAVARRLPRRPGVPRDVPRGDRRRAGLSPAGASR